MLFGDPATALKLPRPQRPQGLVAERQAAGAVALSWTPALDCDGKPVAGYHLYRRSAAELSYVKLNQGLIPDLSFTDRGLGEAPVGATYCYALSAVDDSAEASVLSAPAAVTVAGSDNTDSRNSNSVTTSVSCFISSAYQGVREGLAGLLYQRLRACGRLPVLAAPSA
jgi:hypothetical protein